jgi:L-rhamnose mutarotase
MKAPEQLIALIEALAEYTHDPLGFVYFAFEWGEGELADYDGPDEWQKKVLTDLRDGLITLEEAILIAVSSGHGIGKSAFVSWLILWAISTRENTKGVVTANTESQLKTKTWSELAKWYRLFIGKELFEFTATALFSVDEEHAKTWRIDMIPWSERNSEAFAGLHNKGNRILVVFDEASAIPDTIWEVTEGALTDSNTEIIWCAFGNPTRGSGRFHDCFSKLRHRWNCSKVDSRTTKMTNKDQIQKWLDDYGEDSDFFKVRVRGEFPSASDMQFIATTIVDGAIEIHKNLKEEQVSFAPVIIGVDPAWTGADEFVIYMRQGLNSKMLGKWEKNDDDYRMATIIANFEREYKADAVFIDQGYGTGIYSAGKNLGRSWVLVNFNNKSSRQEYENKRAEMWGEMKKWLIEGGGIEDDKVMRDDLVGPEAFINRRGRLQLESKEDMKKRGIPSPNRADALALTFAFPVVSQSERERHGGYQEDHEPYDPMRSM